VILDREDSKSSRAAYQNHSKLERGCGYGKKIPPAQGRRAR
jgi:hypothetical protein